MGARDMLLWVILADRLGRRRGRGLQYSLLPFFFMTTQVRSDSVALVDRLRLLRHFLLHRKFFFFMLLLLLLFYGYEACLIPIFFCLACSKFSYKLKPFIQFKTSVDHNSKNTSFDTYCPLFPDIGEMTALTGCVTQM